MDSKARVALAPSILSADFGRLGEQVQEIDRSGLADRIHVDVMDGVFVPDISFGALIVGAVRRATSLPIDVHLMITQPGRHLATFLDAGATYVTVHVEASPHLHRDLTDIRRLGGRPGVAINPGTSTVAIDAVVELVDVILVMTVDPGYGGQKFIGNGLARVRALRQLRDRLNPLADVSVDGGVGPANAGAVVEAGGTVLVAGSAVFGNPAGIAAGLTELARAARA
jgi:ribulose-phosphate 3-epimerase